MKNLLLSFLVLVAFSVYTAKSQTTVYSQNFTNGMPSNFTLIINDAGVVSSSALSSYFPTQWITDWSDSAWTIQSMQGWFGSGNGNLTTSCSVFTNTSITADRWMITPAITLTSGNYLHWQGFSLGGIDNYQVLLSTTGTATGDFNTVLLSVDSEQQAWTQYNVDLSSFSGMPVYIAFRNISAQAIFAIDSIKVDAPLAYDFPLLSLNNRAYCMVNSPDTFVIQFANAGYETITSMNLNYSVNNGTPTTISVSGTVSAFSYGSFSPISWTAPADTGAYLIKIWVSNLNGSNANQSPTMDTLTTVIHVVNYFPVHTMTVEEATGTWCGWCPGGAVFMDTLAVLRPASIRIAVHDEDPMVVTAYDNGITGLPGFDGFPGLVFERKAAQTGVLLNFDANNNPTGVNFTPALRQVDSIGRDFGFADLTFSCSINSTTRVITEHASAKFACNLSGDYRFAMVITEDDVTGSGDPTTGTTDEWNQHDYYYNSDENIPLVGAGHDWQNAPDIIFVTEDGESVPEIPAADMVYDHVARAIVGGFWGEGGSLPSTLLDQTTYYDSSLTYTVPDAYVLGHLHIYLLLLDPNNYIMNGAEAANPLGVNELAANKAEVYIYPNPSTGMVNVRSTANGALVVKLNVMNSIGETVKVVDKLNIYGDTQLIDLSSFSNGLYFLQFTDENNTSYVSKIMINR